jgi:hypothetical protein
VLGYRAESRTQLLAAIDGSTARKGDAPEPIVPSDKLTQSEVRDRFEPRQVEIEKLAKETQVSLKEHTVEHPLPVFNALNAHQWLNASR